MTTLRDRMAIAMKAGHTPAEMARAAKVQSAAVSHWIAGRSKTLKARSAVGLAELTGWNLEWWLSGKGPQQATFGQADGRSTGTPAYLAELAAKLTPAQQERLVAVAELLASPQGDRIKFHFSLVETVSLPEHAEHAETPSAQRALSP